jgi:ADP-ribose pyrophosphatase
MKIKRPESKQKMPKDAQKVFDGIIFDTYQWQQKMFDDSYKTFEKIKRVDTVDVIPITDDNKIILLEQSQPGSKTMLSLAGGRIDDDKNVVEAAKRELAEETGYKSNDWFLWNAIQPHEKIDWAVYVFVAKNCQKISNQKLDSGEKIKLKYVSFEEFIDIVLSGEFRDQEIVHELLKTGIRKKNDEKVIKKLKNIFLN